MPFEMPFIILDLKLTEHYNEDEKNDIYAYFTENPSIYGSYAIHAEELKYIKNKAYPNIDTYGVIFWRIAEYYFGYGKFMYLYANKNYIVGYTGFAVPSQAISLVS